MTPRNSYPPNFFLATPLNGGAMVALDSGCTVTTGCNGRQYPTTSTSHLVLATVPKYHTLSTGRQQSTA
eukprot:909950-Rhodomonas_salina.2